MTLEAAKEIYQPISLKNVIGRLKFLVVAKWHASLIENFESRLQIANVPVRSEMLGAIIWPYIHNQWSVETKLDTIASHYEVLSPNFPKLLSIASSEPLELCDFSHISPDVTIKVDYAPWFTREGEATINIFQDDLRVASLAFTLSNNNDELVAYIGAVQGIHGGVSAEKSLEIYKKLTKAFYGLRPRSMLLEVLKVVLNKLTVKKILGVSEQNRHHRHKYFGNDETTVFKNDYNAFWEEHDCSFVQETGFYNVSMEPAVRDVSQIAAKKRSQYKRRNEFVESIADALKLG